MIYHWIHEAYGPLGLFGVTVVFGFLLYAMLASASYGLFFVWGRRHFVPDYRPDPAEMRRSIAWSCYSVVGNAVFVLPVQLLIVFGNGRVYYDIASHGWTYLVFSFLGALIVTETMIYWIHRALHTKWLYRKIHVYHHKFREPTPLSCIAFHPIDSFAQSFPYHVYALLVPINFWLYLVLVVSVTLWAVMIHDRIRWVSGSIVNHTGCHTAHHWYYRYNYGQYFTFWDRLCGTYRSPRDLPDQFMASKVPTYRLRRETAPLPAE